VLIDAPGDSTELLLAAVSLNTAPGLTYEVVVLDVGAL
jgi:hypothetical protein